MSTFDKIFGYRWWKRRLQISRLNNQLKDEMVKLAEYIADNLDETLHDAIVPMIVAEVWGFVQKKINQLTK